VKVLVLMETGGPRAAFFLIQKSFAIARKERLKPAYRQAGNLKIS
jgi:hypothetical protein